MKAQPDSRYRLIPLAEAGEIAEQDVIDFWVREDAMPEEVARKRVGEVGVVAIEAGTLVAVSTVYLRHSERLRAQMWHLRAFVATEHRRSALAAHLVRENRQRLEDAYVSGEDTRAPGILMEVENPVLKAWNDAVWEVDWSAGKRYVFIGENEKGDHVRVYYFQGATLPS